MLHATLEAHLVKLKDIMETIKTLEHDTRDILFGLPNIDYLEPQIPSGDIGQETQESDARDADAESKELVSALDQMIDDEDLWDRRREEHNRYDSTTATLESAAGSSAETKPGEIIPVINALTKLSTEAQEHVLYKIYKDAVHTVKTSLGAGFDASNPAHGALITATSDKFLALWMSANTR